MKAVDDMDLGSQEALRQAILKEMTGSYHDQALLKEHYDRLQELTNISKKTLKRFFREKIRVGPQTRNLLAAIALGRKEDLNSLSESQKDFYLIFLESLKSGKTVVKESGKRVSVNPEFRSILFECYQDSDFQVSSDDLYLPLKAVKKRLDREGVNFSMSVNGRNFQQELHLDSDLLFSHSRPLLLGEAGIGKTTFAKQLCTQWSTIEKQESTVPVYIDLKSHEYSRKPQGVFDFLLRRYFGQELDWMVIEFLEKEAAGYYLLLDGFDDLSAKEKEVLMNEVNDFSEDVRYLILSRPYGFHDFSYPSRSVYKMLGFEEAGRDVFLARYFEQHGVDLALPFFSAYLKKHPVLSILSRSPLNLSRIAALATSQSFYSMLDKVESEVDLLHLCNNHLTRKGQ